MAQIALTPPASSSELPPGNLPGALTSFIGRRQEIAAVKHLLSQSRLLTLTGPGGGGKTRLALRVAEDMRRRYRDGVWLVELASLADEALVPQAVAAVLGVREQVGQSLSESLVAHLLARESLLLLDNCEHLLDACAHLSAKLLAACPGLRLLATSREPLGVPGEGVWSVPPLSLAAPQPWRGPTAAADSLDAYRQSEAVQLFLARAQTQQPAFELTNENGPWVAEVCRRLDGIPLAIELAAARVRAYSVQQIAEHLDDRFRLLVSRLRTVPQRHQALEATLDWSHDLLADKERILLRRLAVFTSGWTLEAAEAVCADDAITTAEVMDLLANLIDKSLVVVESHPGRGHYHYLETIRQYAHLRLAAAGELHALRDRHLDYYLQWAETNATHLYAAQQSEWLELFDIEHDNLRAALEWSRSGQGQKESGLRLAVACGRFWQLRSYFREGRERLQAALNAVNAPQRSEARAWALIWAAELAYVQSDYAVTVSMADEALVAAREADPAVVPIITWALNLLGRAATETGEYAKAIGLFEEALAIHRQRDEQPGIAGMLMELGWAAMRGGENDRAESNLNEAVLLARQLSDVFLLAFALAALGELAIRQGRFDRANDLLEESLDSRQILGDQWGIAVSLGSLGWAALRQLDFDRAQEKLGESLKIRLAIGDKGGIAWCLEKLAEAISLEAATLPDTHRRQQLDKAVSLLGAADMLRAPLHSVIDMADLSEYNRLLAELRAALGDVAFDSSWDKGSHSPLQEVITLAHHRVILPGNGRSLSKAAPGNQTGGLTARELETARLIAQGKSNREIAAMMTVGVKTVETYVTRILNKLGFESRVQIAIWAVERGLAAAQE